MAIQYVDLTADATGNVADTYNISGSNNQLSVNLDASGNQVFTLTNGAAQTAANVVTDLAGLTGGTASVVTVNGVNYVRIRTTSAAGASSTILVNAPANNANTILGFVATTYTGGTNVSSTFVTSTRQNVIDGIEDALNTAGWVTISGHHSANTLVQSSMTPDTQNLRMRLRLKDNSATNCAVVSVENVAGTKAGANSTTAGIQLAFGSSKTWRIIANKYQAFVFTPTATSPREFGAWGVPYLPSWLAGGTVYECIWAMGNAISDTDTTDRGSFRNVLGTRHTTNGNWQTICNNNLVDQGNNSGINNNGNPTLIVMAQSTQLGLTNNATHYRWHDSSAYMTDPIISFGLTATTDEGMGRGQLWDAFVSMEAYAIDATLASVDSHNWWNITNNDTGASGNYTRGSLWVVTP